MTLEKWKIVRSKHLVNDKWLRLRVDRCQTGTGEIIEPYYVLEFLPWVTVFPVTTSGDVVLVRQYRHAVGEIQLELPAGRFDPGESDAVAVARRELAEETGYTGDHFEEFAQVAADPALQNNTNHSVIAIDVEITQQQDLDVGEDIEVELMPLDIVKKELLDGSFQHSLHVCTLFYGLVRLGLIS